MHIRHETNQGVGASIVSGYREALKEGMDIAVVMAGDNQMDPAIFPIFSIPIINRQADYAVGNRLRPRIPERDEQVAVFRQHRPHPPHQDRLRLLADDGPPERVYRYIRWGA